MYIDSTHFPVVRMHFDRPDPAGQDSFSLFEGLLDREQPFVLISRQNDEHDHEHEDPAGRKRVTLWMKAHRARLHRLVRGMVFIEPAAAKRLALKASSVMFSKFWGYPMLVVASEPEALATASKLLAGQDVSSDDGASDS